MNGNMLDTLKTVGTVGGIEAVNMLPSSSDIETTVKTLIQVAVFVIWIYDRHRQKNSNKPN